MKFRTRTLWLSLFAALPWILPQSAHAYTAAENTRDVTAAVELTAANEGDYTHVLPTGRIVSPVGSINGAPNFVTDIQALGHDVLTLNNGATRTQAVTLYDGQTLKKLGQAVGFKGDVDKKTALPGTTSIGHQSFFQGLATGKDGRVYVAGGFSDDVLALQERGKHFTVIHRYPLEWQSFPKDQYPYEYQSHDNGKPKLFYPDAVVLSPHEHYAYVTGMLANSLARIDLVTGQTTYLNVGPYPFAVCLADGGSRLVVSLWGGNAVAVIDRAAWKLVGTVSVGPDTGPNNRGAGVHPTALAAVPGTPDVLVALANVDRVARVDTQTLKTTGYLNDSPYPDAPPGSYPDDVMVWHDRVFVANAGNDDVAVFDLHSGKPLGLIPTGWYPTALTEHQGTLYIAAAKGLGSGPNVEHQWVGDMMDGLIQRVSLQDLSAHLPAWTETVLHNDGFTTAQRTARHEADVKVTHFLRQHIHYVVFILRENKTFDEDLGDYQPAGARADPQLALYHPKELPNLFSWAKHDTLFVNFMADGEVTAQGHQWTTAASDSDFVQRTWPEYYSGRGLVANPGWTQSLVPGGATGTGGIPQGVDNPYAIYDNLSALGKWSNPWISYPGRLFIFNDLLQHHIPFEDFGEFVSRSEAGNISAAMKTHLATSFPGWDRMILDTYRAKKAISWLKAHPGKAFPHFVYIWLPDDHTAGRQPCYYTPDYYVANNDHATAEFVHYLSTTPEWKHMVVFLTEDDAQSGADHINAHRTFAVALGPWVKRGYLETRSYSQVNILKTTEAIFGLPPMSQWDQNASVFAGIWRRHPDDAEVPMLPMQVPLAFNPGTCDNYTLMRREAGATGHYLSPNWVKHWFVEHQTQTGASLPPPAKGESYSPTALLKVPGPEQMRQEWIGSEGDKSYHHMMTYLHKLAKAHHAPLAAYQAGEVE